MEKNQIQKSNQKTNQIFEESVRFSFNLETLVEQNNEFQTLDHISEVVTFQDFVQKLYLFHNFCSETNRSYFITLSNSPSINPKNIEDEIPF